MRLPLLDLGDRDRLTVQLEKQRYSGDTAEVETFPLGVMLVRGLHSDVPQNGSLLRVEMKINGIAVIQLVRAEDGEM